MTRRDFQQLARLHLRAASTLLRARQWPSAYHLAGFAIECGLKACVAKRTRRHDFPPKETHDIYTHDLTKLLTAADLKTAHKVASDASKPFDVNWTTVKDWKPESRYDHSIPEKLARDLYQAITARQNGVMRWIRERW
jgi:HEPN domain-containing protein